MRNPPDNEKAGGFLIELIDPIRFVGLLKAVNPSVCDNQPDAGVGNGDEALFIEVADSALESLFTYSETCFDIFGITLVA